jgi:hypothetical protein
MSRVPLAKRAIVVAFSTAAILLAGDACAGSFKLKHGNQFELCRESDAYIQSSPDLGVATTDWPLDTSLKDVKKPRWEPVDAMRNIDIIKVIYLYYTDPQERSDLTETWSHWQPRVMPWISNGDAKLYKTTLDADNFGTDAILYRYSHPDVRGRGASRATAQSSWYVLYDAKTNQPMEQFRGFTGSLSAADAFFFKGQLYMISWDGDIEVAIFELAWVPVVREVALTAICAFSYSDIGGAR